MKRFAAVTIACVLASTAQADQNSAFQDAKAFAGSKTQGVFTGVSGGAVTDKIPGYGMNPAETQLFQEGQGALPGPGVTKMQNCASYVPGQNKIANQECEAVNFLARNPDVRPQFNIGNNDPIVIGARDTRKNAESFFQSLSIGGGTDGSAQCTTKTVTTPAQYTTETCVSLRSVEGQQCTMDRQINIDEDSRFQCDQTVNAYETLKCKRGFSANVGTIVDTKIFEVNRGAEVPSWTGRTFDMNFNVQGSPAGFRVVRYQADNYGQLWVNGVKVYDNTMGYYSYDMRYSVYGIFQVTNCWFGECYENYAQGLRSSDGTVHQIFDDDCNYGCRGVSPNIDITQHIKEGDNLITLVCINAGGIGPCYINITGTASRLAFLGALTESNCAALEQRATP